MMKNSRRRPTRSNNGLLMAKRLCEMSDMPSVITTSSDNMSDSEIVALNVGGVFYTTTRSTLTKYPDSMLGAMFNGSMKPSILDKDGRVFIDRDGQMFGHILEFLRAGKQAVPKDFAVKTRLYFEAQFYQIEPLIAELNHMYDVNDYIHVSRVDNNITGSRTYFIRGTTNAILKVPPEYIDLNTAIKLQTSPEEMRVHTIILKICDSYYNSKEIYSKFVQALTNFGWNHSKYLPLPYFVEDHLEGEAGRFFHRYTYHHTGFKPSN